MIKKRGRISYELGLLVKFILTSTEASDFIQTLPLLKDQKPDYYRLKNMQFSCYHKVFNLNIFC
jgi:hypothetical protein